MAEVNSCLKSLFTFFNILFAIVGGFILALALLSQIVSSTHGGQALEGRSVGLAILYFTGSVTMVISILGAYGAHKENRVALIVFLVCMVVGSLLMLVVAIPSVIARAHVDGLMEEKFREVLPLDRADADIQNQVVQLQETFHCCGLFSYADWEQNIPESCVCDPQEMEECRMVEMQHKMVYSQTCFPIVLHYVDLFADISLGVLFALAVLALLGLALSSLMIHQIHNAARPIMMLTVPVVVTPHPPKYQELYNPPGY
ncbi:tetraspanin-8-like isoform X1 [Lampris incognitus]|uniref:tetraspanin-8-like isoform X1 n=1 Tax=Lampris incognitus TaxID=2546036 RepID=UPI0024B526B1|nr:tetraspanin-8-like isoform X1 [Lampris incognitus]